jgi:putative serine protease PepD
MRESSYDTQEPEHVNRNTVLRRGAPIAAALALGGGAGAGIYAAASHGTTGAPAASTEAAAQPAAVKTTVSTLTQLYDNVTPGVVDITVDSNTPSSNFGFGPGGGGGTTQAEGSGFVVDTSGHIVTNQHVVDGATSITVRFKDGKTTKATLVGTDPSTDIAVIKVDVAASELHPLTLGTSSTIQPGQDVVAIGSPFGLTETMTSGIVSAIDRTIQAPNNYSIAGAIQTDAPINHGNSGGPLLDTSGKVIGVNAQIDSDSGGNDGVGFAIPIDSVKSVVNTLIAGGKVEHAYLGIHVGDAANSAGAQVSTVQSGSPASKAGVKAGDVITAVDGKAITKADDLTAGIGSHAPNDKVTLTVTRDGKTVTLHVTLGVRPS